MSKPQRICTCCVLPDSFPGISFDKEGVCSVCARAFPGLEQRRLTLAGLVMAGQISREEALRRLDEEPEEQCPESVLRMFLRNLEMSREEFDRYIDMGPRHLQFRSRSNPVIKAAMKLLSLRDEAGIK